jgi:hypothetical protein
MMIVGLLRVVVGQLGLWVLVGYVHQMVRFDFATDV